MRISLRSDVTRHGRRGVYDGRRADQRESVVAYALASPTILLLLALLILPAISVFAIALTNWEMGSQTFSFVGRHNFIALFNDRHFWQALRNTSAYMTLVVPGSVVLGLLVALLVESQKALRSFYRAVHFLPFMGTISAMAMVWETMLHPTIGLINRLLESFGLHGANWLHDDRIALLAIALIGLWQNLGFAMVLFLAGLKAIPSDLYEAAAIDAADGALDRLRLVTIPLLGPTTMFVLIVMAIRALQTFDVVVLLTQGGPLGSTQMILPLLYQESFVFLRTGYGAAIAVVYLTIVTIFTLAQARILDRRVHY